jgi:hypothetical protein
VAYNSPIAPASPLATPTAPVAPEPGRRLSALQSLAIAQQQAEIWDSSARWVAIMPTTLVASNFGFPLGAEGWFFKFDLPDSPVEYFIHISDGTVTGASEAQPLIEPPYRLVPLDPSTLKIDSDFVAPAFLRSDRGKEHLEAEQSHYWDYRLVHLEGMDNPVWSLFDADEIATSLINIDAVTGQVVQDPFE